MAPLLAAPLADYVFRPGMSTGGALAPIFGPIFGMGASRGVGLMISILGVLSIGASLLALSNRTIRRVELDLPDHTTEQMPSNTAGMVEQELE